MIQSLLEETSGLPKFLLVCGLQTLQTFKQPPNTTNKDIPNEGRYKKYVSFSDLFSSKNPHKKRFAINKQRKAKLIFKQNFKRASPAPNKTNKRPKNNSISSLDVLKNPRKNEKIIPKRLQIARPKMAKHGQKSREVRKTKLGMRANSCILPCCA